MAHLAEARGVWGPFLVVAPASTLHNWDRELQQFTPGFKVRGVCSVCVVGEGGAGVSMLSGVWGSWAQVDMTGSAQAQMLTHPLPCLSLPLNPSSPCAACHNTPTGPPVLGHPG